MRRDRALRPGKRLPGARIRNIQGCQPPQGSPWMSRPPGHARARAPFAARPARPVARLGAGRPPYRLVTDRRGRDGHAAPCRARALVGPRPPASRGGRAHGAGPASGARGEGAWPRRVDRAQRQRRIASGGDRHTRGAAEGRPRRHGAWGRAGRARRPSGVDGGAGDPPGAHAHPRHPLAGAGTLSAPGGRARRRRGGGAGARHVVPGDPAAAPARHDRPCPRRALPGHVLRRPARGRARRAGASTAADSGHADRAGCLARLSGAEGPAGRRAQLRDVCSLRGPSQRDQGGRQEARHGPARPRHACLLRRRARVSRDCRRGRASRRAL